MAMTIEEAKHVTAGIIIDKRRFKIVRLKNKFEIEILRRLAPHLRDFFSKYYKISAIYGDMMIRGDEIGLSEINPLFIKIGIDADHTELVVRQYEERVYEIDGFEKGGIPEISYDSIYHLLIDRNNVMYEEEK